MRLYILVCACCVFSCDAMKDCFDMDMHVAHTRIYSDVKADQILDQLDSLEEEDDHSDKTIIAKLIHEKDNLKQALIELKSDQSSCALLDRDIISNIIFRINELD